MNVTIIFNKKKYRISIHKLDSILNIKNKINKNIFNEEYNLDDIQLYYNNKLLGNIDYCDKYNINKNDILKVHLKKKGGGIGKTILFYLGCLITILIPFFILPTGLNTAFISLITIVMTKAKDGLSKFLVCELKYKTLVKRFSTVITFLKYFLMIMATYTLITMGCITACLVTKGSGIYDDPNKICKPYHVGSTAGLILTTIYFFIYVLFRSTETMLKPFERWASNNFMTATVLKPIITFFINISNWFKFIFVYMMPGIGSGLLIYHRVIDQIFPPMLQMLEVVSKIGCSPGGLNNMINNYKGNINQLKPINEKREKSMNNNNNNIDNNNNSNNNNNPENENVNNPQNNNKPTNSICEPLKKNTSNLSNLYGIDFKNGIMNNSNYEEKLERLRNCIKPSVDKICEKSGSENCCNSKVMHSIAEKFYTALTTGPISGVLKGQNAYVGAILGIQGMYEYALNGDDTKIDFEDKSLIEKQILLKSIFEDKKTSFERDNQGKKLLDSISNLLLKKYDTGDEKETVKKEYEDMSKNLQEYLHKDDFKSPNNNNTINDIKKKIDELESMNKQYSDEIEQVYEGGNTPTKIVLKKFFVNALCNLFSTAKGGDGLINEVGGLNELMDILKCGSGAGSILSFCYILTIIGLLICGFLGIY